MMAGMTGAGKSLMVNNIVNFVYGVNCEDDFRFKLILEADELADRTDGTTDIADSMTRFVTGYRLNYQKGFRVRYEFLSMYSFLKCVHLITWQGVRWP